MDDVKGLSERICSIGATFLEWPPDVFGFCAYLAKVTGIYTIYARSPEKTLGIRAEAVDLGSRWRKGINANPKTIPRDIRRAWRSVCGLRGTLLSELQENDDFVRSVLLLIASADEACAGVGLPSPDGPDGFEFFSEVILGIHGNLCRLVPADTIRVLPKLHTPQSGLNIRSLSHHLALCSGSEVKATWAQSALLQNYERKSVNILLAPWPLSIGASAFVPAKIKSQNGDYFGYVDFKPTVVGGDGAVATWLRKKLRQVSQLGQKVDVVVFPECSLNEMEWGKVSAICQKEKVVGISGVRSAGVNSRSLNSVRIRVPQMHGEFLQYKHHRWQLNEAQIRAYNLGGTLATDILWWENIEIRDREVHFLAVDPDLTIAMLICEDLARQDPVAELVRAVGPNLVVALLMDGPQLNDRWASRYASVLAEDPGCSVLTLSSLGMVERSTPAGASVQRVVASWRDAINGFAEIRLPSTSDAAVLNIQFKMKREWTIDGRSDGEVASYPVLCGSHFLRGD